MDDGVHCPHDLSGQYIWIWMCPRRVYLDEEFNLHLDDVFGDPWASQHDLIAKDIGI